MSARRAAVAAVAVAALVIPLASCSQRYSAERDGKKLGEGICDLRTATSAQDAADATKKIKEQLDDLGRKVSMYTAEDRRDVDENIADLAEHTVQGNDLLENQDLAVLQRSISNIAQDADEVSAAAWEGISEGLEGCTS